MRARAFALLGLIAAGLAAMIVLELDGRGDATEDPALPVVIRRTPATQARARAVSVPVDHTDEWVATILARPLFSRDRRPAPPAASTGPSGPANTNDLPRLTGVMVGPFGRSAIFAAAEGGKPTVVNEGSNVGPYTVSNIGPGEVTVEGPEGSRVLHPVFDPNAPRREPVAPVIPSVNSPLGQPGVPGLPGFPGVPGVPRQRGDSGPRLPVGALPNNVQPQDDTNQAPSQ